MTCDVPPSDWILRWAAQVPAGARVLDVACGSGRHARLFAARGAQVLALDRDRALAAAFAGCAGLRFVPAELEAGEWPVDDGGFDAVVVTRYLHRPLFARLRAALAPGGLLLYETFAAGQARYGRPSNPDFLLAPGELLAHCRGLHLLAFEDGIVGGPAPARVQRIAARAAPFGTEGLALAVAAV